MSNAIEVKWEIECLICKGKKECFCLVCGNTGWMPIEKLNQPRHPDAWYRTVTIYHNTEYQIHVTA